MRTLAAAALVLAGGGSAGAQDFYARAQAGYNQVRSDAQNTNTFAQVYDLRFERPVSPVILYRLALRGQDDLGTSLVEGVSHDYENREIRPLFDLRWTRSSMTLQLGYDLTWNQTLNDGNAAPSRLLQHAIGALTVSPSDTVRLSTGWQWRVDKSGSDIDTSEVRGEALVNWKSRTVTVAVGPTATIFQDGLHDFSRLQVGALGTTTWSDELDGGRVSASLGNTVQWNLLREHAGSGMSSSEARRELPAAALYAVDRTPLDSRDAPLLAVPALLDGDLAAPTEIDLGPNGVDYQELGLDMGRFVAFDEVRVDVRSQAGNAVPRGGDIVFEVYTSADARDWTIADSAPVVTFVAGSSSYVIQFQPVNVRYLKVVTFGVNGIETRVTELEVFSHSAFAGNETRQSQIGVDSVQASFNYAPLERLRLAYTGLFNLSLNRSDASGDLVGLDWNQTCYLTLRLWSWLEVQGGGENRAARQDGNLVGAWNLFLLQLTAAPMSTMSASLRGSRMLSTDLEGSSTTDEARLSLFTRLLASIDSTLELGYGRQTFDTPLDRIIDKSYLAWNGNAQVTRTLRLTGNAALQRSVVVQGGTADEPLETRDYSTYGEASWRPSQQLLLSARLGYAEGSAASGLIQRYRVDWHPFPGGALQIGFSFDEDQQNMTGYRSRRVSFFPSWLVNKHATLNFNWTDIELTGPEGTRRNELLFVLLTINT